MGQADERAQRVGRGGGEPYPDSWRAAGPGHDARPSAVPGTALAPRPAGPVDAWADLRPAYRWLSRRRPVLIGALILIAVQVAWRAQLLGHLYFYRDDYAALDLARRSPLGWHYLCYVGQGHLVITERLIAWVLARSGLYNWGLASAVTLALLAASGVAAFLALRALFGNRPAILVPLAVYLFTPLGLADLGWWSAALESLPLQVSLLLAVHAHIRYARTMRRRYLVAAIAWVVLALASSEKGLLVPVLLFAVTSAFLPGRRSWLANMGAALRRYWPAWLGYAVALAAYAVVLLIALGAARPQAGVPAASAAFTFGWGLLKNSLVPAAFGGPWRWWPLPGHATALALPPQALAWTAITAAAAVVVGSIVRRPVAWRAWASLAIWVAFADMLPVMIGKLNWYPVLLALNTRYAADARPVLALCLALAFLPVRPSLAVQSDPEDGRGEARLDGPRGRPRAAARAWRSVTATLVAIFLVGAVWSAHAYQSRVTGTPAADYVANATAAVRLASPGTPVLVTSLPDQLTTAGSNTRTVLGAISPGQLRWVGKPDGTVDGMRTFGPDGRLFPLWVFGTASGRGTAHGCWPARHGTITVPFARPAPYLSSLLRIGYLWGAARSGQIQLTYGAVVRTLTVSRGLHTAYLPVHGSANGIQVTGAGIRRLCIGDVEAGQPGPATSSSALPSEPQS